MWARAELADDFNRNALSCIRAGQLLGRGHAAKGEHALSVSAFDSAFEMAKQGRHVWSELLTVRGRAAAGSKADGAAGHWPRHTGSGRLEEALGRMEVREDYRVALLRA